MILVTGPTGSGKSTTLYATLNIVSRPEVNVITVEDPVEYRLPGINQVQTNIKAGLTFASALRSILRSDPDIVLIGEIRDHETGQIAVEAALTGHLVLSTLHTNDAPSAVTRLTEMGIEPFLVGSALDACWPSASPAGCAPKCKEAYTPTPEALVAVPVPLAATASRCPSSSGRSAARRAPRPATRAGWRCTRSCRSSEEIERLAVEHASATVDRAGRDERGHEDPARRRPGQGARRASPRSTRSCASSSRRQPARLGMPTAYQGGALGSSGAPYEPI